MSDAPPQHETEPASAPGERLKLLRKQRKHWERQFEEKRGFDFSWYTDEAPRELVAFVDSFARRDRAVDVGCGAGVLASFLASAGFSVVGFDIAHKGVLQAKLGAAQVDAPPAFLVAAAPYFPFPARCFDLVLDRGCAHLLDETMWDDYFAEAARVLAADGHLYLIEASGAWRSMEPIARKHFTVVDVTPSTLIRKGNPMPMANVALRKLD
jgi:SAM-dependent methyltransferase